MSFRVDMRVNKGMLSVMRTAGSPVWGQNTKMLMTIDNAFGLVIGMCYVRMVLQLQRSLQIGIFVAP